MRLTAALCADVEFQLERKGIISALTPPPKIVPRLTATGMAAFDAALLGGFPCGVLTELVGPECSGRTTAALALIARIHAREEIAAWVDVADALAPESAAALGVDLGRLLWIRCGARGTAEEERPNPTRTPLDIVQSKFGPGLRPVAGGGSPHPRSEGRDMPREVEVVLHAHGGLHQHQLRRERWMIGTPAAPNRPLTGSAPEREEQVNSDRLPPRRGDNVRLSPRVVKPATCSAEAPKPQRKVKPWSAIEQALRSVDLLLQAGGFSVIVLDLGSTPPEYAWRIPLATWFRFRAACERTRTTLLVLTQHPCSRSSAELVVRMDAGLFAVDDSVVAGMQYKAAAERNRAAQASKPVIVSMSKPPQAKQTGAWRAKAVWA